MTLTELNLLPLGEAETFFSQTCAAKRWVTLMQHQRPYSSKSQVLEYARQHWQNMQQQDFLHAFDAHPMIGDINSLHKKYDTTKVMAGNEQDGAQQADEATLLALQALNLAYRQKHGFIFIICASGLSARAMLDAITQRINNSTAKEIDIASTEQINITLLRLQKGLTDA
ncbi:MAG: 2-oxo-4-hydroxy-4-carboxy-5-ureidoimidazoline decarboxylase [Paraglaciecola sp.]|jgi:2-oxo-4-hydroxy-4-carboxy-5-ureidoimidazoline decarboxylase